MEHDRAIVTPVAGTTRDTVEEVANIQGIPFVLVDTAGLTETSDPVERLGIARSRQALTGADMVILMLDSSQPLTEEDTELIGRANGKSAVTVANKSDLAAAVDSSTLPEGAVHTSMLTREGLELLKERMVEAALNGKGAGSGEALVSNVPAEGCFGVGGRASGSSRGSAGQGTG